MIFKDWRLCDQSPIDLQFKKDKIYYVHARAWHLKGYLLGRHSYLTWWSQNHKQQLVVEYTDRETLEVQSGKVIYGGREEYQLHAPYISNRPANARWFGADPVIKGYCTNTLNYNDIVDACEEYPYKITTFDLLKNNCNTFTSYLLYKLNLDIKQPWPAIGHRSKQTWKNHGLKI